jgi:hypothetical protein
MRLGIEKTAMIWPSLAEAMDEGHCGLPMGEVDPPTTPRFLSSATSINCRRPVPGQALADIIRADEAGPTQKRR